MSLQKLSQLETKATKLKATAKFTTVWAIVKPFLSLAVMVLGTLVPKVSSAVKVAVDTIDAAIAEGLLK